MANRDLTVLEGTEIIELSDGKLKYINDQFKKVTAKMYDYDCDVKLKVEKETFRAHKDILGEASDYFSAMFSHNMQEKEQNVIELRELSPQGFTAMMDYFYHGHVTVGPNNIEDVLEAARFFHIEWLVNVGCHFLIKHLCLENYDTVIALEDKYVLGNIHAEVFKFISNNFIGLAEEGRLNGLQFELFHELLAGDYFIDATEAFVMATVWKWLQHDVNGRRPHQVAILSLIRFKLLEPEDLDALADELLEIPEIKKFVDEAYEYHACPSQQCLQQSDMTEVRGSKDVLVLYSALDDMTQIQYKVPETHGFFSESVETSFLDSLFEFASVEELGNFLFVAGGYDRRKWCSTPAFYRFNPRNRSWAQLSSMSQPRISFGLCAAERGLYAIAGIEHIVTDGFDREIILNSVEYYDPTDNLWVPKPPLPCGCFSPGACVVDEKVYVSGGISDDPEHNVPAGYLHVYVPGDKEWAVKSPMITERQGHGMVSHCNKLYVFGGYTAGPDTMRFANCLSCESYDIETNQWSQIVDLPAEFNHFHNSLAVMGDRIYMLGGSDVMRTLHAYNVTSGQLEEAEVCGAHVQKLVPMKAAFPPELMGPAALPPPDLHIEDSIRPDEAE